MITTSNLPPIDSEDLGVIDLAGFISSMARPDKAEIKVGSLPMFAEWVDRKVGLVRTAQLPMSPTFSGVPVVESFLVPPNMAVLLVNGEVQGIIKMDGATA